jgi:hypothetical protein
LAREKKGRFGSMPRKMRVDHAGANEDVMGRGDRREFLKALAARRATRNARTKTLKQWE